MSESSSPAPCMDRSAILSLLKQYKEKKASRYGISRIGIFGSRARGSSSHQSDVDVVVEMSDPDIFAMVHVKEELQELLRAKVDLVRNREDMNPYLKRHLEEEAMYA